MHALAAPRKSAILHILVVHTRKTFMALKATIFKADLQISDMDRHYYQNHTLTIARHPSETDERMMIRVLAFALHASEALNFGKGLSDIDEPDLWEKDLTGAIDLWIEVGQPDDKRILKACGRAARVIVYSYSSTSHIWWGQIGNRVERAKNLSVIHIDADTSQALEKWRSARCNCNARFRMARSGSATMTRWCRSSATIQARRCIG